MKVVLVGVSGKAGHGKDTLADIVIDRFAKNVTVGTKLYFADELKKITQMVFNLGKHHLWDEKGKDESIEHLNGLTGRDILQRFGTDVARNIYEDIWVYHYSETLKKLIEDFNYAERMLVFSPDVRFPNEYNYIKNAYYGKMIGPGIAFKSMLIRVVRPSHQANGNNNHPSETALDSYNDWDHIVVAKNLAQLEYAVSPIVRDIEEYFNI